ncbi:MAG: O-antigen ligase family protein [bacterium]|nr:O-antigen ligase family protein [bacterium]
MQKKIEFLFKVVVGLTFFVPLAFFPTNFIFPFIVPKILIFRSLTFILLGLYIILLASNWKKYIVRNSPLNIVILLFTISFGISTFVGLDWYRSLWDNHERMLGLFTVTHYVIYYFVVTSVIREWSDWKWLLRTFLLAGGIVMAIAFIQRFDPKFLLNTSQDRSAATLGNPIYVGGYGLFLSLIGWLLIMKEKGINWKIFAGVVGFLGFLGVFFSGSRGALVGLLVGICVLVISYFITLKGHKKVKNYLIYFVVFMVALTGVLYSLRQTKFVQDIPAVGRLLNSTVGSTVGTRMMAWGIAIEGWKEYPIFGWGPTNYYFAFNKYYKPEFLEHGYMETWFDNAHNIVLNTLAERGLVGVIIYLGIFFVSILYMWKLYKKNPDKVDIHLLAVFSAFLMAHLAQTVSVFDNPTSYLYFFFFLALVNSYIIQIKNVEVEQPNNKEISIPVVVVASLVVALMIYSTNINPARANMATLDVLRGIYGTKDIKLLYEKATSIPTPHIDDIRNDVSRTLSPSLRGYVQAGKQELARDLFKLAYEELEKNRKLHPLDLRVHAQQSLLIQEAATLSGDKSLLFEAEKIMEDGLAKSPKRQQFIYTLAGLKIQLNKLDEAEALYRQAIADDEKIGESWWRLALMKSVFGDLNGAVDIIKEAQDKGINFGGEGDPVVASILEKYQEVNRNP